MCRRGEIARFALFSRLQHTLLAIDLCFATLADGLNEKKCRTCEVSEIR